MEEPCTPISKAKDIWKIGENGLYKKSFGVNGEIIDVNSDKQFLSTFLVPIVLYEEILKKCSEEAKENENNRFLKRFRFHFLYFYRKIIKESEKKNIKISDKKIADDEEYLEKVSGPIFERIVEKIISLYHLEVEKDEYKNAPIRDLTISSKVLEKLEKAIMSRLPKIDL